MRLSLILFVIGVVFITLGYLNQIDPGCSKEYTDIKYISSDLYKRLT